MSYLTVGTILVILACTSFVSFALGFVQGLSVGYKENEKTIKRRKSNTVH